MKKFASIILALASIGVFVARLNWAKQQILWEESEARAVDLQMAEAATYHPDEAWWIPVSVRKCDHPEGRHLYSWCREP